MQDAITFVHGSEIKRASSVLPRHLPGLHPLADVLFDRVVPESLGGVHA